MTPRSSGRRIVVTGLGAVSGWGRGARAFWDGLCAGGTRIRRFERFEHRDYTTHLAGEVPDAANLDVGLRRLPFADRFAVLAALEAARQAALPDDLSAHRAGVYFGSSTGGMFECEELYAARGNRTLRQLAARPLATQQVTSPGDAVARHLHTTGPVETISSACASATLAIEAGLQALRDGAVDVAVVGGADSLCRVTYAGFNALQSVDPEPSRPFRADRRGLSLGEGGAVLILEREDDAARRGATILAELAGGGSSADAHHMTAPQPEGAGAILALRRALADAGLEPADVDLINAHGTGTELNDRAEYAALAAVLGERAQTVPVVCPKTSVGHLLGSAGAIEAVATVQMLLERVLPPTPGPGNVDPATPVAVIRAQPVAAPQMRVGVSLNLAFGGCNAALVSALERRMSREPEIWITGLGSVSALGSDLAEVASAERPRLAPVDRSGGFHDEAAARTAALVDDPSFREWIPPMARRRMSRPSQFAVAAAKLALADAALDAPGEPDPTLGVVLATAFGPAAYTERLVDQILESPAGVSPALFTECVANAPAGQVAIHVQARGSNYTVCAHEAGPLAALQRAAVRLRSHREARTLAGNVEEVTPLLHAALDRLRALATANSAVDESPRPFDRRRNGCLLAEGATVALLETAEVATARNARPYARIVDWESAFDPSASCVGWGRGAAIFAAAIGRMLERAGVDRGAIDLIVSGASGAVAGDRLEAATLRRVWDGCALPPVLAPKGITGEYGGAFLARAVQAVGGATQAGAGGFDEPDPELGIVPHRGGALDPPRWVLVTSLASGGGASWMLLQNPAC